MKKFAGYRTLAFSALVTLAGLATSLSSDPAVKSFVADHFPAAVGFIGVGIAVLRVITTGPVPVLKDTGVESGGGTPESRQ